MNVWIEGGRDLERTVSVGGVWTETGVAGDIGALAGEPSGMVVSGNVGVSSRDDGDETDEVLRRRLLRGSRGVRWLDRTDRCRIARR